VQLSRNAFEATWLPEEAKASYLDTLERYAALG
jgi:hypothetical protein